MRGIKLIQDQNHDVEKNELTKMVMKPTYQKTYWIK